jgi:Toprim domain
VKTWNRLCDATHHFVEPVVGTYLRARGIDKIPDDAQVIMPPSWFERKPPLTACSMGAVFAFRNDMGKFQGMHVIWLNGDANGKREQEPQRQSYGLVKGNFIPLCEIDYEKPLKALVIGEGVETTLAAMQLTGLPGIALGGKGGFKHVVPPRADLYILLADHGAEDAPQALADWLLSEDDGCEVRIALPPKPKGANKGYDWNDALLELKKANRERVKAHPDKGGTNEAFIKAQAAYEAIEQTHSHDALKQAIVASELAEISDHWKLELRVDALANLADSKYDEEYGRILREFKRIHLKGKTLDAMVAKRRRKKEAAAPPLDPEKLRQSAKEILACDDVLGKFTKTLGKFIAGEKNNAKLLYLMSTSRLFQKPMHYVLKGQSSTGKSELRKHVLKFFPPESIYKFTQMTAKALFYDRMNLKNRIFVVAELPGMETEELDYQLRELMSEGRIELKVTVKTKDGQFETKTITIDGPIQLSVTTTRNMVNVENETRLISMFPDESQKQTKSVIMKRATIIERGGQALDLKPWHDYQRYLATQDPIVEIPFATAVAELMEGKTVRQRRDFDQVMYCVMAHAFLHGEHRERSPDGHITATIEQDYKAVYELMANMLAIGSEMKLRDNIVAAVQVVYDNYQQQMSNGRDLGGVTVKVVMRKLKVHRMTAQRNLESAEEFGLFKDLEERPGKGRAHRYRTTDLVATRDGLVKDTLGEVIPNPKRVKEQFDSDEERAEAIN